MSNFGRSAFYGGIYAKDQHLSTCEGCDIKSNCKFKNSSVLTGKEALGVVVSYIKSQLRPQSLPPITQAAGRISTRLNMFWEKSEKSRAETIQSVKFFKNKAKRHVWNKQEIYLPILISAVLLLLVFLSKTAFSKTVDVPNNLPIENNYKVDLAGFVKDSEKAQVASDKNAPRKNESAPENGEEQELKEKIADIVEGTPMSAMTEAIAEKPKPVAAFIVGIAMKESKFGVYSPKLAGRDCYNYWGFKGGGKTVSGGYSCFSSPEEAVDAVGSRIEKMVAKGVRTPAQAISWKCGSSCAGHGAENVSKWISDVAINYYKINS